jgi:hypothetical protein
MLWFLSSSTPILESKVVLKQQKRVGNACSYYEHIVSLITIDFGLILIWG